MLRGSSRLGPNSLVDAAAHSFDVPPVGAACGDEPRRNRFDSSITDIIEPKRLALPSEESRKCYRNARSVSAEMPLPYLAAHA